MNRDAISLVAVLNESGATLRRSATPWVGLLWLTTLPVRLLQVHFFSETSRLGTAATRYGDYLWTLSCLTGGAFVLSLAGRAVFVRAYLLALQSRRVPGAEALRVPPASALAYLYAALLVELLFWATAPTCVAPVVFVLLAGLAAATAPRATQPRLLEPLRLILAACSGVKTLAALLFVFGVALLLAWVNLYAALRGGVWLIGGACGLDLARWEHILRPATLSGAMILPWPAEGLPRLLLLAGATLAVEPFWLGALVSYVQRLWSRDTGEDLHRQFAALRHPEVAA